MTEDKSRKASLEFAKMNMIAVSNERYHSWFDRERNAEALREYTLEEVERIIQSGSLHEQQVLSRTYFYKNGYYAQILTYYSTLLKYAGILIPNPAFGNELSTPYIFKRYNNALDYLEKMKLPQLLTNFSLRALIDGCYYGVIREVSRTDFVLLDLPAEFCRSNFKDFHGNDVLEFDVTYFNSIIDEDVRKDALKVYPKVIADHYRRYKKG